MKGQGVRETGDKRIEIIPLARKKLAQRNIPVSWIEEAVRNPEQVVEGHGGRLVAHKRMTVTGKERLLRVVYEETTMTCVVVTAYLTSDVQRYWRDPL
jgi:hypothetical protein